ncbi:Cyanovirin-N [Paraphoma chrysanthemicola]|uniref:Cyanovirin-N n=1 Tax=Paraphoma chrysanthemicola TaxID=798071 RepID=A0A8K0QUU3_9PLEO|nr:Cyanovirin-N [Paraphoma chrysanthemicola]
MFCLNNFFIYLSLFLPLVMAGGFSKTCDECIIHYHLICKCYTGKGVREYLISTLNLNPIIGNQRGALTYPGSGYSDTCHYEEIKVNKDKRIFLSAWCWMDDPLWENERKTSIELTHIITNRNGVLVAD